MALKVTAFTDLGDFAMNAYLIHCPETLEAILVDPGAEPELLLASLRQSKVERLQIFLTHAHLDHVGAVAAIRQVYAAPCWLPRLDQELYQGVTQQCQLYGVAPIIPENDVTLYDEGLQLHLGAEVGQVLLTPGHSPGSSVLWFAKEQWLFSGDLIFQGSIGRVDLWGSDPIAMEKSLRRLKTLPPGTQFFPGHGPSSTIGEQLRLNPFLRALK